MCSSVGLGLTLLPTLHTSYMACRGSGVRVSLAPFLKKPIQHWHLSGPHGPLFSAKQLNITFDAQSDAQNSGVRALSGASAENALCIRLNDRGVGAAPIKDL